MKIRDLKIGVRLALAFAVLMVLMTAISVVGIYRLREVGAATSFMAKSAFFKERYIRDLAGQVEVNGGRIVAGARNPDPVQQKLFKDQVVATIETNNRLVKQIEALLSTDAEHALWTEIVANRKLVIDTNTAVVKEKAAGNEEAALKMLAERMEPQLKTYIENIRKLVAYESGTIDELGQQVEAINQSSAILITALTAIGILFGAGLAYWITRSITKPFGEAVQAARKVAAGDLSHSIEVRSSDETGQLMQALKDMNESLRLIVSDVRIGIHSVATASGEIATGNLDLSSRTEEQASSLAETASAMDELTSTVKRNAESAVEATKLALNASGVALDGGRVVRQVIDTMSSIDDHSKKIVDIISVIDGIAFQTNILALNAAVEAARAGEQGRGFAVVASEVRSLAQRSASAAKEIKILIGSSVEKVNAGSKLVEQAGITIDAVVQSVKRVTDIVGEISAASQEQSTGIGEVNRAVTQMDEVTQQNAALVEEAAAASQSLQDQAAHLAQTVSIFVLGDFAAPPALAKAAGKASVRPATARPATKAAAARSSVDITPKAPALPLSPRKPAKPAALATQNDSGSWEEF